MMRRSVPSMLQAVQNFLMYHWAAKQSILGPPFVGETQFTSQTPASELCGYKGPDRGFTEIFTEIKWKDGIFWKLAALSRYLGPFRVKPFPKT